jgi:carbon monoxide dehydrogenase subunit G
VELLNNEFLVSVPIEHAWAVLTDLERIAPCMPGAQLLEVEGDEYRGVVKVKVGPITAQYKGTARIIELDESAHRAVLRAEGREARGQGAASATITATLDEVPTGTQVRIETELEISGKVAQFGRGVLGEVSGKLLDQFVKDLEANVLSDGGPDAVADAGSTEAPAAAGTAADGPKPKAADPEPGLRIIEGPAAAPVDLLDAAGGSVVKRAAPLVLLLVVLAVFRRRRRGRD